MIVYEPSVSICVGPRRSPAALCNGPRRCVCPLSRIPALCVRPRPSLCWGPAVSSPGALCVGARRSLCRALLCPGPGALSVRAWQGPASCRSASDAGVSRSLCRAPPLSRGLCWARLRVCGPLRGPQSLRGPPPPVRMPPIRSARHASGHAHPPPNRWLDGTGRAARASRLLMRTPPTHQPPAPIRCRASAISMSGPGALCVGSPHSLCRARRSLCRGCVGRRFLSGPPGTLHVAARRSLSQSARRPSPKTFFCQVPAVCVPAPVALWLLSQNSLCQVPRLVCRALPLFIRARHSLCRTPAVYVSRPNDLCVGAQRSLVGARHPNASSATSRGSA